MSCVKEEFIGADEIRLGLYFVDWPEIPSSGKRLDLCFVDWLAVRSSAKASVIISYKQDSLVLADFLGCWRFGPVLENKEDKMCKAISLRWLLHLCFNMTPLMSSFTDFLSGSPAQIFLPGSAILWNQLVFGDHATAKYPQVLLNCFQETHYLSCNFLLPLESSSRKAFLTLHLSSCITQPLGLVLPLEAAEPHTIQ